MHPYSIVVVAHERPRALLGTLLNLRQHARPSEVVLVDNGSSAALASVTKLAQLPARILRLDAPTSLSAALNAGLDAAANDVVLLQHGDTRLESDPAPVVDWLGQHPDVGVVGGLVLSAGSPTSTPQRVLNAGYAAGRGRLAPAPITTWEGGQTDYAEVEAASDVCMLVRRRDGIRFDERYWFGLQDVDLCFQYRQRGERVVVHGGLRVVDPGLRPVPPGTELEWMVRSLASRLLYHERWCSDLPLETLPPRSAIRGAAAIEHLTRADEQLGVNWKPRLESAQL